MKTIDDCYKACDGVTSVFQYGRRPCADDGCECLCVYDAEDGKCEDMEISKKYNVYAYKAKKIGEIAKNHNLFCHPLLHFGA